MLVLSRAPGEEIVIRDTKSGLMTTITLVRIDRNKAIIGLTADDAVEIVRKEIIAQPSPRKRAG